MKFITNGKILLQKVIKKEALKCFTNLVEGERIATEGFGNFYPSFSPDGAKFLYISNKNSDYFGISGIYLYDFETKKERNSCT